MASTRPPRQASDTAPLTIERVAVNSASESENKIHDEAEARRYGYRGALVPGVTLYAYLSQVFVPFFGSDWLSRGSATLRLPRPVYEGERVICAAAMREDGGRTVLDLTCSQADGTVCADGSAWMDGPPAAGDDWIEPDMSDVQPPDPRSALTTGQVPERRSLAPLGTAFTDEHAAAYADETADPQSWYRGPSPFGGALLPPGVIAGRQARLLRHNFAYGPSIHTASAITNLAPAPAAALYRTGGVIRETFERKGNHYLVLDALTTANGVPVARIRHTSIFQPRVAR